MYRATNDESLYKDRQVIVAHMQDIFIIYKARE